MIYSADFGSAYSAASAAVAEYSAAGAVTVARTTTGVVHIANGFFIRDFTPDVSTAVLVWDVGTVFAYETLTTSSGGLDAAGVRSAIGLASANLDTQLAALPTEAGVAAAVRLELAPELANLDAPVSSVPTEDIAEIKERAQNIPLNLINHRV